VFTASAALRGWRSARVLLLAALNAFLACAAVEPSWDMVRFALFIGGSAALLGAWLVWLSPTGRRVAISLLVILHFAALLSVVIVLPADADGLWLGRPLFVRLFRPYLDASYLRHPYTFYAPGPGPERLLWFRIQDADGQGRWIRLPEREQCLTG